MPASSLLIWIAIGAILVAWILWMLSRKLGPTRVVASQTGARAHTTGIAGLCQFYKRVLREAYRCSLKVPLLKKKTTSLRQQLAPLYSYDEWLLRERTVSILLGSGLAILVAVSIFITFDQNILSWIMLIVVLSVAESLYRDVVITRAEIKLLRLSSLSIGHMRHAYHRYKMVDAALEDTIDRAHPMLVPHLQRVANMIADPDTDTAMSVFEEAAPNRYYKMFGGLSKLVAEYGDPKGGDGSSYLKGLAMIVREMQTELVMRTRLDYLLGGLKAIAVIPILFTDPLERWAITYFPAMELFYNSKLGWLLQLTVFLSVLICHRLLQQLHWRHVSGHEQVNHIGWSKRLLDRRAIRRMLVNWVNCRSNDQIKRAQHLLHEANESMTLEQYFGRRFVHAIVTCTICFMLILSLHFGSAQWMWNQIDDTSQKAGLHEDFVKEWISNVSLDIGSSGLQLDLKTTLTETYPEWSPQRVDQLTKSIVPLAMYFREMKVAWWEVALPFIAGWCAFYATVIILRLRIRIRQLDMRTEISQMQSLCMMLRAFERMTAEMMMEWMSRCTIMFRRPLQVCLLNWESGSDRALKQLRIQAPYPDFVRLVDKLELAHNHIPLVEAFDDAEQDWGYEQDMLRHHYEASIEAKAGWGRWLGFAPIYALIFLYLVIPLVWMSAEQMRSSFEQIRNL
ncbi:GTPase SAR1 [Paenibacillus sp. S-12]|uniref:GTPase SAR1 n=1 Tax=Paenibacillus sp. S-12 TaxID=3031371 RepID=UPI0025A056B6|nr:GTPase SAR1 [Paenibacillus sp. S-12]